MGGTNGGRLGHPTGLMPPMNPNLGVHLPTQTFFPSLGGVAAWLTYLPMDKVCGACWLLFGCEFYASLSFKGASAVL